MQHRCLPRNLSFQLGGKVVRRLHREQNKSGVSQFGQTPSDTTRASLPHVRRIPREAAHRLLWISSGVARSQAAWRRAKAESLLESPDEKHSGAHIPVQCAHLLYSRVTRRVPLLRERQLLPRLIQSLSVGKQSDTAAACS